MPVSVSNHEAIVSSGLAILVAYQSIAAFGKRLPLNVEQCPQILKQAHLIAVVLSVVFDVSLMGAQFFN